MTDFSIKPHMIELNGHEFELFTLGDSDSDTLLLFLHGFPLTAHSWRFQMKELGVKGFMCWALNQRGYGNSYSPAGVQMYNLDLLVSDVASLIKSSGYSKVILIGHDWGGVVSWKLAQDHPDLIDKLIILNCPHGAMMAKEMQKWRQLRRSWYAFAFNLPWLPEWYLTRDNAQAVINIIKKAARNRSHFTTDDYNQYQSNALRPGGMRAMLNWYRAVFKWYRVLFKQSAKVIKPNKHEKIKIPTLIIWGEKDVTLGIHTVVGTEKYVEKLTTRFLPDIGHLPAEEDPVAVNSMILAFINGEAIPGNKMPRLSVD